jgi:hypothetical protein
MAKYKLRIDDDITAIEVLELWWAYESSKASDDRKVLDMPIWINEKRLYKLSDKLLKRIEKVK